MLRPLVGPVSDRHARYREKLLVATEAAAAAVAAVTVQPPPQTNVVLEAVSPEQAMKSKTCLKKSEEDLRATDKKLTLESLSDTLMMPSVGPLARAHTTAARLMPSMAVAEPEPSTTRLHIARTAATRTTSAPAYAFVETVRGREARAALHGYGCVCCSDFVEAVASGPVAETMAEAARLAQTVLNGGKSIVSLGSGGASTLAPPLRRLQSLAAVMPPAATAAAVSAVSPRRAASAAVAGSRLRNSAGSGAGGPVRRSASSAVRSQARVGRAATAAGIDLLAASRHRAFHPPAETPEGYWDLGDLPSDADIAAKPYNKRD